MPSTGYITVQTVTSRAEIPVEGAVVTIGTLLPDGTRRLLSLQRTDESGWIETVAVTTPDVENSLTPEQQKGWTDVTVTVSRRDYETVRINTVQVFPGVTTTQEVVLVPEAEFPTGDFGEEEYDVPPQGL